LRRKKKKVPEKRTKPGVKDMHENSLRGKEKKSFARREGQKCREDGKEGRGEEDGYPILISVRFKGARVGERTLKVSRSRVERCL